MKRPSFNILLTQLITLAALAVLGVVFAYRHSGTEARSDIVVELAKALLQLALIAVAGGIVSHLIGDYVNKRSAADNASAALDQLRTEFLRQFRQSYYSVKTVRRSLRAAGLTSKFGRAPSTLSEPQVQAYTQAMKTLNRAQMELEQLQIGIESMRGFSNETGSVVTSLRSMENYLRGILTEFEESSALAENRSQRVSFDSLTALEDFTHSSAGTSFRSNFSGQFRKAWTSLSNELLPMDMGRSSQPPVKLFGR